MEYFELRSLNGNLSFTVDQPWVRVGRALDNTIVIRDTTVSRYHLNFYIKDSQLIVEDAGSQNGFLINGTPTKAPTVLSAGDRLFFGNLEYVVVHPGAEAEAPRPPVSSQPIYTAASNMGADSGGKNRGRMRLYGGIAVLLAIVAVMAKKEEPAERAPATAAEEILKPLPADAFRAEPHQAKSLTEITAAGKFKEGLREYDNGNFGRSILLFEEARTNNPSMADVDGYLQDAGTRLKGQLETYMLDARNSFSRLQFYRAKGQATQVLAILAEQIPGYTRKLAQESIKYAEGTRPPTQEEILLKIPCDKTTSKEICDRALELIVKAREQLGEEDVLK